MYIYIISSIIILVLVVDIVYRIRLNKREDKLKDKLVDKYRLELESRFAELDAEAQKKISALKSETDVEGARLAKARDEAKYSTEEFQRMRDAQERAGAEYVELQRQKNDEEIHRQYDNAISSYRSDVLSALSQIKASAQCELEEYLEKNEEVVLLKQKEISELNELISDFQKKREVINQEILRQRAIEEQTDFYRVCLTDTAKEDIEVLRSIAPRLSNRSFLDKIIYDTYIAKPTQEMIKRVLNGGAPSGIYKITRLKTGEVYVGRSVNVRDRWGQHLKSAFGVGTIAHSILHTTMEKDGVDNFTFELLEEVPKDQLGEREKYWINFYGSKEYGLNMKAGG